jgi:hypothetical protein
MSYSMNPDSVNNKKARENSSSEPPNSEILVLYTIYITNAIKLSKWKKRDQFCPTFQPGKYGQTSSTSAPSISNKVEYARRNLGKSPREYTHTHMGVHEDFIKETRRRNP